MTPKGITTCDSQKRPSGKETRYATKTRAMAVEPNGTPENRSRNDPPMKPLPMASFVRPATLQPTTASRTASGRPSNKRMWLSNEDCRTANRAKTGMPISVPSIVVLLRSVAHANRQEIGDHQNDIEVVEFDGRLDDGLLKQLVVPFAHAEHPTRGDVRREASAESRCQHKLSLSDLRILVDEVDP